jgi:trans-aconitate methyltransferase
MPSADRAPDFGLMLAHRVAGFEHLHFGCWKPGDALTYENFVAAQGRYTERLLDQVPATARSVLDVGCGVGATSRELHARGYAVQSVTPDPGQVRDFRARMPADVLLHPCRFQDLPQTALADVILFSESVQYLPLDDWARGCLRHLDPDGTRCVLVADWFLQPDRTYYGASHDEAAFRRRVADEGFALRFEDDITEDTAPTLAYLAQLHARHLRPAFDFVEEWSEVNRPRLWKFTKLVAGRRMERFRKFMLTDVRDRLDPDAFKQRVRYRVFRFEVDRGALAP